MFLLCLILSTPIAPQDHEPPLADRIVSFAESKLGEKVGDGQCSGLLREAFQATGAKRPDRGPGGESPWGTPVASASEARPGDILEFKNAVVVERKVSRGRVVGIKTLRMEHHVGIISQVERRGNAVRFVVLHQNAGSSRALDSRRQVVQRWLFQPDDLLTGSMTIFRPVADDSPPSTFPAFDVDFDFEDEDEPPTEPEPTSDDPERPLSPLAPGW